MRVVKKLLYFQRSRAQMQNQPCAKLQRSQQRLRELVLLLLVEKRVDELLPRLVLVQKSSQRHQRESASTIFLELRRGDWLICDIAGHRDLARDVNHFRVAAPYGLLGLPDAVKLTPNVDVRAILLLLHADILLRLLQVHVAILMAEVKDPHVHIELASDEVSP